MNDTKAIVAEILKRRKAQSQQDVVPTDEEFLNAYEEGAASEDEFSLEQLATDPEEKPVSPMRSRIEAILNKRS